MPIKYFYRNLPLLASEHGPGWVGDASVTPDGHILASATYRIARDCGMTPEDPGIPVPSGTGLRIEHRGMARIRLIRYAAGWDSPEYCDETFVSGDGNILFGIPEDCVGFEVSPIGAFAIEHIHLQFDYPD